MSEKKIRVDIENKTNDDLLILHVTLRKGRYRPREYLIEKRHLLQILRIESKRIDRIDGSFEIYDKSGSFIQFLDKLNLGGCSESFRKLWTKSLDQNDFSSHSFVALDRTQKERKESENLLKHLAIMESKYKEIDETNITKSRAMDDFRENRENIEDEELELSEQDERRLRRV